VLGEDSITAAHASLAAAKAGKFRAFHKALFDAGRPTPDAVAVARKAAGVTVSAVTPDIRAEIDKNYELATAVRANATPLFVIGEKVMLGAVGYDALKAAIAEARK